MLPLRRLPRVGQGVLPRSRPNVGSFRWRVLTCCSRFPMFVGCFILEAVVLFSMFLMIMSPIQSKQLTRLCLGKQTLKQTMKRETVMMISCHVVSLKRQTVKMISCHVVVLSRWSWHICTHGLGVPCWEDRLRSIWSEMQVWLDFCGPLFQDVACFSSGGGLDTGSSWWQRCHGW